MKGNAQESKNRSQIGSTISAKHNSKASPRNLQYSTDKNKHYARVTLKPLKYRNLLLINSRLKLKKMIMRIYSICLHILKIDPYPTLILKLLPSLDSDLKVNLDFLFIY